MPGKGKFGADDAWTKGAGLIDLGNLGKKKDEKEAVKASNNSGSVYIKADAPVQSSFMPMANMTRKYK